METIIEYKNNKLTIDENGTEKTYQLTDAVNKYLQRFGKLPGREITEKKTYQGKTINRIKIKTLPVPQKKIIEQVIEMDKPTPKTEFKFIFSFKIAEKIPTVQYGNKEIEEYRTIKADTQEEINKLYSIAKAEAIEELKATKEKLRGK